MSTRKRNVPIKVIFLTLILQFAICALSTQSDAQGRGTPRIAIFFQPGFPTLGPGEMVSPKAIAEALRKTGLRCETLDLETLRSSAKFNAGLYDAVILPYGNAYPQVAFPNLRAFHKAGGCLIMSGIPFTHPIVSTHDSNWNYTWLDRGHDDTAARFDSQGIGVGGFNSTRISGFSYYPNDPWQLASVSVDWRGRAQTINTLNLPSSVEVRPALSVQGRMAAGLVIHRRGEFAGAVDAWTNYPNPSDLIQDAYSGEQLMERGTVAALAAKGLLTPVQEKRAFGVLNSLDKPVIYANITLPTPPRPYPTLQPKRGKPAERGPEARWPTTLRPLGAVGSRFTCM